MSGKKAEKGGHFLTCYCFWRRAIFSCGHGLKFLEKPTLKCGLEGREVSDSQDFIHLLAGSLGLIHVQTQRNNTCEDISLLLISGRLMRSPAAHMRRFCCIFWRRQFYTHALGRLSVFCRSWQGQWVFSFWESFPTNSFMQQHYGFFERQRRDNIAVLWPTFGRY